MEIINAMRERDLCIERNDPDWAAWDSYVSLLLEKDRESFS